MIELEKIAVYTGTRNLYKWMVPTVKSLIANSDVDKIYLLIEDDKFPEWLPELCEVRNVSGQKYFVEDGPNMGSKFTYMAMMRAALAKEFPEYDRILSLDVDLYAEKNISELWNLPIDECFFAASREAHRSNGTFIYTNCGVNLQNTKKLRETGKVDELIHILNTRKYTYLDQDVFSIYCQGYIYNMPSEYNKNDWTEHFPFPKIVHYAGYKDWSAFPAAIKWITTSWNDVFRSREKIK